MPIYEYKCEYCSHQLEILQKISDTPAQTCPECGEAGLRKMVSAAAFKLKGTGWYETDFKHKKPKADAKNTSNDNTSRSDKSGSNDTKKESTKSPDTSKSPTKPTHSE